MGKRGPKPKFTDVACPNKFCRYHLVIGQGNVVGNGTYQVGNKRIRRYLCRICGRAFCDRTVTAQILSFMTFVPMKVPLS